MSTEPPDDVRSAAAGRWPLSALPPVAAPPRDGVALADALAARSIEPTAFRNARELLALARPRPEVELERLPAPRGLAPHALALGAVLEERDADHELATGRFVLLHDPHGHDAWQGEFRFVTLARAELEPEIADDPLLPEVGWAWLLDSLRERGALFHAESGTVSRCASQGFGELAERPAVTTVEIRASWTPSDDQLAAHLEAWCELLATCAGLPPDVEGVSPIPSRRRRR